MATQNIDLAFSDRFAKSMEQAQGVPVKQHGRLTWLERQIKTRYGKKICAETVRKWSEGLTKPREQNMRMISEIFGVNIEWLQFGTGAMSTKKAARLVGRKASGATHYVAGSMMLSGLNVAFPRDDDAFASEMGIDIYAIVDGEQRTVIVTQADDLGGGMISIKTPYPLRCTDLIAVNSTPAGNLVYRIPPDIALSAGHRSNDHFEILSELGAKDQISISDVRISPVSGMDGFL
jgi:hypothetical protein